MAVTLQTRSERSPKVASGAKGPETNVRIDTRTAYPALSISNQATQRRLLQRKLTINQSGDRYEREADRVAEAVMRKGDGSAHVTAISRIPSTESVLR